MPWHEPEDLDPVNRRKLVVTAASRILPQHPPNNYRWRMVRFYEPEHPDEKPVCEIRGEPFG